MKSLRFTTVSLFLTIAFSHSLFAAAAVEPGFTSIFDGESLKGWHVDTKTGHSGASGHKTGGNWVIQEGSIVGSQDMPGNGGILITDDMTYSNFEVIVEMNNDFGPDSGLFLRCSEEGKCYQALIDYHSGGSLMGIYGEGLKGALHIRNFNFLDAPDKVKLNTDAKGGPNLIPFPFTPEKWGEFWHHGQWNTFRARIEGKDPVHITTWINNVKFCEWTGTQKELPEQGGIALQVHGGNKFGFTDKFVRYRNIQIKRLD